MQLESFNGTGYSEANSTFGGAGRKASAPTRPFGHKMRLTGAGRRMPGSTKNHHGNASSSLEEEHRSYADRRESRDSHGRKSRNDVVFISDYEKDSIEEKDAEHEQDEEPGKSRARSTQGRSQGARRNSIESVEDMQKRQEKEIRL